MAQNFVYKFHLEKTYFQILISMTWSENKGLFGFSVSIIHNSVSIIHNSKYMGSTAEKCVWHCFQFLFSSLNSDFWVMSYGNWKHILDIFMLSKLSYDGKIVISLKLWAPQSVFSHFSGQLLLPTSLFHTRPNPFHSTPFLYFLHLLFPSTTSPYPSFTCFIFSSQHQYHEKS